jgi:hypothetical protein
MQHLLFVKSRIPKPIVYYIIASYVSADDLAKWNDFESFELHAENLREDMLKASIKYNRIHMIEWMFEKKIVSPKTAWQLIVELGKVKVAEWFIDKKVYFNVKYAMNIAAEKGKLGMLKWLNNNFQNLSDINGNYLAKLNSKEIKDDEDFSKLSYEINYYLFIIPHVSDKRYRILHYIDHNSAYFAALNGHSKVLKWLNKNYDSYNSIIGKIASEGNLKAVKLLYKDNSEYNLIMAMNCATKHHHNHVANWLSKKLKKNNSIVLDEDDGKYYINIDPSKNYDYKNTITDIKIDNKELDEEKKFDENSFKYKETYDYNDICYRLSSS